MKRTRGFLALLLAVTLIVGGIPMSLLTANADAEHPCGDSNSCTVCTVAGMINALPAADEIDINNAASVVAQIHDIDRIKGNLTDDEYDELIKLVDAGNDGSGVGLDVPVKYMEAVDAVTKLNAGGSLYVEKKYAVGDAELDWSASDATFMIERIDGGFEPLSVTLSDLSDSYLQTLGMYSVETDGWTSTYPLPAGKYRITETGYHAVTVDGEELTTTATCSYDGEEGTDSAVITIEPGGAQNVLITNTRVPTLELTVTDSNNSPLVNTKFELFNPNNVSLIPDGSADDKGICEFAMSGNIELEKDKIYTVKLTCEGYADETFSFYYSFDENNTFQVYDESGNKLDQAGQTYSVSIVLDKYEVYPVSGEITYGSSLDSFIDFEKTMLNDVDISDEAVQQSLTEKLSVELVDEKGYTYNWLQLSTLPVGQYTLKASAEGGIKIIEPETDIEITPRTLTKNDFEVTANNKEYDGKNTAEVSANLKESVPGEDNNSNLEIGISGTFADANAAKNKEVTYEIDSISSSNYTLENGAITDTVYADITPMTLTADHFDVTVDEMEYNGHNEASITAAIKEAFKDIVSGITASVSGFFTSADAGEDIQVEYTINSISGDNADNYQIDGNKNTGTATGKITPKPIEHVEVSFGAPKAAQPLTESVTLDTIYASGTLTWKNGEKTVSGTAAYNTTYTAVVELTPKPNYCFDVDNTTVTINSETVVDFTIDNGKLICEKDFTTRKPNVESLETFETITKANGVSVEDLKADLPKEIKLITEDADRDYTGTVEWDTDGFNHYVQDSLEEQTITISGTVILPEGVEGNPISLVVEQKFVIQQRQIDDQDGDGKPEPDTDGDGVYEGTEDGTPYLPDQDGDNKAEPDTDKDGVYDGTDSDNTYIPDQDGDGIPEEDDDKDGVYEGTKDGTPYLPDQDSDNKAEPDTDGDGIYEGSGSDNTYIPDQDGDGKPEPDTDGDNIYEGTKGEEDYIPDQDVDGKYEVDDNKDDIFDNEDDTKHYVPDGNGRFVPYFYTYKVSDDVLTWTLGGSKDLTFTVEGPAEKFEGLLLNGTAVDESNYSYVSGSTIITLKASFLNSLSVGEYPLVADYVDGSGETSLKIVAASGGNGSGTVQGGPTDDTPDTTPDDNTGDTGNGGNGTTGGNTGETQQDDDGTTGNNTSKGDQNDNAAPTDSDDEEEGKGVDTGDHSALYLWLLTALTAMAAFVTCHFTSRKNN